MWLFTDIFLDLSPPLSLTIWSTKGTTICQILIKYSPSTKFHQSFKMLHCFTARDYCLSKNTKLIFQYPILFWWTLMCMCSGEYICSSKASTREKVVNIEMPSNVATNINEKWFEKCQNLMKHGLLDWKYLSNLLFSVIWVSISTINTSLSLHYLLTAHAP